MKMLPSGSMRLAVVLCLTGFGSACSVVRVSAGARASASYLESGVYVDRNGEPQNKTKCSTTWVEVPKSNPKRWTCSGTVSGSGPLEF
jgi:hypothetical protein